MQFDRNFVFAGALDRMFEHNLVPIDIVAGLVLQSRHDIVRRD